MKDLLIRKGERSDVPQVMELIRELAAYEKAPDEVTNNEADMELEFDAPNPAFRLLVAEKGRVIVGIAVFFVKYSTWKGRGLYLDDIVVREAYRGKGIGSALFNELLAIAREEGFKQLHWQVLDWNEPAINFYKKYNASLDSEWINCKLEESQLRSLK
jgi:GNAT superfamily N-acetyltransferase